MFKNSNSMSLNKAKYVSTNLGDHHSNFYPKMITYQLATFYKKKTCVHLFIKQCLSQYGLCYSKDD